jgi:hypothetical protein
MALPTGAQAAAQAILQGLGAAVTPTGLALLEAWIACEKGDTGDAWQWNNPLNTTQPGYGGVDVAGNAAGVKIYPSQAAGIQATVATLTNGRYPHLLAGLLQGHAATFFARPQELATWGTDPTCVQQRYQALAGSGAAPTPSPAGPTGQLVPTGAGPGTVAPWLPWAVALVAGGLLWEAGQVIGEGI